MENHIFKSLYTKILVSPCVYKHIIYKYIFSYSEAVLHKNDRPVEGLEHPPRVCNVTPA